MRPTRRHLVFALATALVLGQPGCATIIHGTHDLVDVSCDSPTAVLRADGTIIAPGEAVLKRNQDHALSADQPGARPVTTTVNHELSSAFALAVVLLALAL